MEEIKHPGYTFEEARKRLLVHRKRGECASCCQDASKQRGCLKWCHGCGLWLPPVCEWDLVSEEK